MVSRCNLKECCPQSATCSTRGLEFVKHCTELMRVDLRTLFRVATICAARSRSCRCLWSISFFSFHCSPLGYYQAGGTIWVVNADFLRITARRSEIPVNPNPVKANPLVRRLRQLELFLSPLQLLPKLLRLKRARQALRPLCSVGNPSRVWSVQSTCSICNRSAKTVIMSMIKIYLVYNYDDT